MSWASFISQLRSLVRAQTGIKVLDFCRLLLGSLEEDSPDPPKRIEEIEEAPEGTDDLTPAEAEVVGDSVNVVLPVPLRAAELNVKLPEDDHRVHGPDRQMHGEAKCEHHLLNELGEAKVLQAIVCLVDVMHELEREEQVEDIPHTG